jgi:hypothetical protein
VLVLAVSGCSFRSPTVGGATTDAGGTISGTVSAANQTVAVVGRKVTAVDVSSGARFEASTSSTGGYTMQVPKGVYRLEVELRAGETVARQPAETDVNASDLDSGRNFEITVGRP